MTFFKSVMRIVAAAGASALVLLIPELIALFQGPAPTDVSPMVWGIVGTIGVFLLNWALGKIPRPPAL